MTKEEFSKDIWNRPIQVGIKNEYGDYFFFDLEEIYQLFKKRISCDEETDFKKKNEYLIRTETPSD